MTLKAPSPSPVEGGGAFCVYTSSRRRSLWYCLHMHTDNAQQIALNLRKIEQTKERIDRALHFGNHAEAAMHRRTLDSDLRRHADLTGFGYMNR